MSLRDLCLEPMILPDVQPSRTYFVSLFEELGLTPRIESPSIDIVEDVTGSGLAAAWLKRGQLTKPAQLFAEFCREQLTAKIQA